MMIQPRGIKYLNQEIFENLFANKINFKFYMPIRDPIERLKSLFFYLKSEKSNHEPTHGIYKSKTFEDFILKEAPDNWLVSNLSDKKNKSKKICQIDFDKAIELIKRKNFLIFFIQDLEKMLDFAFKKYQFSFTKDIPNSFKDFLLKFNKNNKNKWEYEPSNLALDKKFKKKLNQITKYEYMLYELI